VLSCEIAFFRDQARKERMKSNAIIALLLCVVTWSQPAFTVVQPKSTDDEPPHVTIARPSSDCAHVSPDLLIARTPAVPTDPTPSSTGDMVVVAMPFSSLQLSPTLVEYLSLTRTQAKAIQRFMDRERPTTEPLMDELRTISAELRAVIQQSQNTENEGTAQSLVARQARVLKQLIKANSRLQQRINDVLDPQQRKKLDFFKRTSEVTAVDGN
jgi:Spy/CpxP family protein refolding chaperone